MTLSLLPLIVSAMHEDKVVRNLYTKKTSKEFSYEQNLRDYSQRNAITLERKAWGKLEEILAELGLEKAEYFEGISVNYWGIARYRASDSFDLFIEYQLNHDTRQPKLSVLSIFIAPHQDKKYDAKLFTDRRWVEIKYDIKAPQADKP